MILLILVNMITNTVFYNINRQMEQLRFSSYLNCYNENSHIAFTYLRGNYPANFIPPTFFVVSAEEDGHLMPGCHQRKKIEGCGIAEPSPQEN